MINIYILLLENDKYYIGKTSHENLYKRIQQHFDCNGSSWTKLYKPVKTIEIIENADSYDEDKYTKKYMSKYGIENVRGGTYSSIQLTHEQMQLIQREITHNSDLCFKCKGVQHFIKDCPLKEYEIIENISNIKTEYPIENKSWFSYFLSNLVYELDLEKYCNRCFRNSHQTSDCFALYDINKNRI